MQRLPPAVVCPAKPRVGGAYGSFPYGGVPLHGTNSPADVWKHKCRLSFSSNPGHKFTASAVNRTTEQLLVPIQDELRAWFGQSLAVDGQQSQDAAFMQRALQLSRQALGHTAPNPMVGCVIVDRFGRIVGEGYHPKAGEPHAEVSASSVLT